MYPYRIIVPKEYDPILERLKKDRTVTLHDNKKVLKSLGWKLKPIRKDIFIGFDKKTYESNISLKNPLIELERTKNYNWVFKHR